MGDEYGITFTNLVRGETIHADLHDYRFTPAGATEMRDLIARGADYERCPLWIDRFCYVAGTREAAQKRIVELVRYTHGRLSDFRTNVGGVVTPWIVQRAAQLIQERDDTNIGEYDSHEVSLAIGGVSIWQRREEVGSEFECRYTGPDSVYCGVKGEQPKVTYDSFVYFPFVLLP